MSLLRSFARHRWLFWLHAGLLLVLALTLLAIQALMRSLLISTFVAIFLLMVTGFFLVLSGLLDFGAGVEALLDKEAHAWIWVVLAATVIFTGVVLFLSPELSIERLLDFAVVHALALGFLETRLANRLRHHPAARSRLLGFARLSTAFVVLLLMGTLYGNRYSVLILSIYCVVVAAELIFLPRPALLRPDSGLPSAPIAPQAE
jgi:uncharacterized membrane protein HdeD (DUF308 family)